uniref:Carrier domain-containing protein n=1 Tax=Alexandrium catenella TaxID=2925 RepID=A0A7S1QFM9_ALECA
MAEIRTHNAGGKAKLSEMLKEKRARAAEQDVTRAAGFLRPVGDRLAEQYTCMADDSAASGPKREAAMLFSAAEGFLEAADPKECLKVAQEALDKFKALGDTGKDGVADALHLIVDAHRLDAYINYKEPEEGLKVANEELAKFKDGGNKRGQATMQLAIAEMGTDNLRLNKRRDALEPVTEALTLAKELGDKKLEAKCLIESAFVRFSTNEADKMLEEADAALKICEETKDNMGKGLALFANGLAHVKQNNYDTAVQKATSAQKVFEEMGKKALEAGVLHTMAIWRMLEEKAKKAVPLAEQALAKAKEVEKGKRLEAVTSYTVCEAMIEAKNAKGALKVAKDALDKFTADGAKKEQAMMQEALTAAHLASDAAEKAVKTIDSARQLAEELGEKRYEARIMIEASATHIQAKEKDEALEAIEKAVDLAQEDNDLQTTAYAQRELATFLMFEKEDYKEALKTAQSAAESAQQDDDKVGEGKATLQVAFAYSLMEENSKALAACNDAQEMYQECGNLEGEAQALAMIAELKAFDGKFEAALEAAEERLSIFREMKDLKNEAKTLCLVASLHNRDKNWEEAEKVCKEALTLAGKVDDADLDMEINILMTQIYFDQAQDAGDRNAKTLYGKASKTADEAVKAGSKSGEKAHRAVSAYWKAQTLVMEDKLQDAQRTVSEAEGLFKGIQAEQGQAACLHLLGTLQAAANSVDKALDTLDRALALSQSCKDTDLEYEISSSIYNIQRQIQPAGGMMMMDPAMMQQMMPAQGMDGGAMMGGDAGGAEAAQSVAAKPKGLDPAFVRKQLMTFVKDVMATDDELELDSPFMEAGMDSLSSVSLMSMVAKEFQMALSPSLVFDFPTVRALEDHLVEESKNM